MAGIQKRGSWLIDLGWIAGVTLLALILRVIYGSKHILIYNDSAGYILHAMDIFDRGALFDPFKGPGYPLLIGLWANVLGGNYILGAKVASMVSGSLLVVVAYLLGKKLYGRSVAITASLLIAINTALIEVATRELTEATYTFAIFSALAVTVWAVKRQHLVLWALSGFLFGFSYWVRPEGFFYLGLVPIFAFIEHWVQMKKPVSGNLSLRVGVFLLAGFLMAVPYILHIHRETGAWTINGRTVWAALVFSKKLDRTSLEGKLAYEKDLFSLTPDKRFTMLEGGFKRVSVFSNYSKNILFKMKDMIRNWIKTYELLPSVFTTFLLLFMGIGLWQLKWRFPDRLAEFYFLGTLIPWVFVYPLYEIDFENLTPVVPILTLWAALGIVSTAGRFSSGWKSGPRSLVFGKPTFVIAVILLLVSFFESPPYIRLINHPGFVIRKDEDDLANLEVAKWIRENLPEDTTLMARKLFLGAYAHRKMVVLPFADYKDVVSYARLKGVDIIIMDEKFKHLRPQLAFLFDQPGKLEDLVPVFTTQNSKGQRIILYKVLPEGRNEVHR